MELGILIKSSRRPWCLDRLLRSLRENLLDFDNYRILVADDRTDENYLAHIQEKYPQLEILRTPNLQNKPHGFISNWVAAVRSLEATHILVLEDDQWLTRSLDLDVIFNRIVSDEVQVFSMSHGTSGLPVSGLRQNKQRGGDDIAYFIPPSISFDVRSLWTLTRVFLLTPNSWLGLKYLSALTILSEKFKWAFFELSVLNPICGAIFTKNLWLAIWPPNQSAICENIQVRRTFVEMRNSKNPSTFLGVHKLSFFRTSHVSSISAARGSGLDWPLLNSHWSEMWLNGQLPIPPKDEDWDENDLAALLRGKVPESVIDTYLDWVIEFKATYGLTSNRSSKG